MRVVDNRSFFSASQQFESPQQCQVIVALDRSFQR
jgi:hypothetical protein